jgi:hypothetical protein
MLHGLAPIAEEIRHGLNHWDSLTRFLDDGRIDLDALFAGSRTNALFSGQRWHERGHIWW